VQLWIEGFSNVEGATLQEAGDELVAQLLHAAIALRAVRCFAVCSELRPDPALLLFLWEFGEFAAAGRDPRELLFGPNPLAA
jgi:hypothetical protein